MFEATTGVPGRESLGQDHAEALAAQRGRAEQVRRAEQAPLLLVGDAAGDLDAFGVEQQRARPPRGWRRPRSGAHRLPRHAAPRRRAAARGAPCAPRHVRRRESRAACWDARGSALRRRGRRRWERSGSARHRSGVRSTRLPRTRRFERSASSTGAGRRSRSRSRFRPASSWSRCGRCRRPAGLPSRARTSWPRARLARARGPRHSRRSAAPWRPWRPPRERARGS